MAQHRTGYICFLLGALKILLKDTKAGPNIEANQEVAKSSELQKFI
jgi:hypothetical protein